ITPYIRLTVRLRPRTRTVEEVKVGLYGTVTGLPVHLTTRNFYDRTRIRDPFSVYLENFCPSRTCGSSRAVIRDRNGKNRMDNLHARSKVLE
ncbi:hypothetical protein WG66_004546, partial [Moniliophthora roreri]